MSETLNYCFPSKHSNNHLPAFRTSRRASSPFRRYFIMRYSSSRTNLRYRWPYASIPRVTASHRLDGRFPPTAAYPDGYRERQVWEHGLTLPSTEPGGRWVSGYSTRSGQCSPARSSTTSDCRRYWSRSKHSRPPTRRISNGAIRPGGGPPNNLEAPGLPSKGRASRHAIVAAPA